jgi:hypothetical protein
VVSLLGNTHTSVISLTWMGSLHSDAHSLKDAGHGGGYIVMVLVLLSSTCRLGRLSFAKLTIRSYHSHSPCCCHSHNIVLLPKEAYCAERVLRASLQLLKQQLCSLCMAKVSGLGPVLPTAVQKNALSVKAHN